MTDKKIIYTYYKRKTEVSLKEKIDEVLNTHATQQILENIKEKVQEIRI